MVKTENDNPLTLDEVGKKTLKYVNALPKQSSIWGRIEITLEHGRPHILKVESLTLAKNVV